MYQDTLWEGGALVGRGGARVGSPSKADNAGKWRSVDMTAGEAAHQWGCQVTSRSRAGAARLVEEVPRGRG